MFSLADIGIQDWRCSTFDTESLLVKHLREVTHLDYHQIMADEQAIHYEDYSSTDEEYSSADDEYKCKHCDKGYITQGGLTKHEKSCKSKPSYICKHCDKGYTTQGGCTKHEKACKPKPSCIYPCVSCSLPFNTKGGLTIHRRTCADALSDRNIKQLTILKM